ncbi:MAG TPA: FeoB-associated Cys-rich membrane protein [Polaribacter sp.]|nr:FeoB-associated Cys-rich membrane protein [Polaribacter sp.]
MQEIFVYILLIFALFFLVKKYVLPSKSKGNCNTGCDCH